MPAGNPVSGIEHTRPALRIGVIRNPKSHYNRDSRPEHIDLPHVLRVVPQNRPDIARALAEFAAQGIDLLVIDGGDGTVRDVLTEGLPIFGGNWPRLVVLPSGKTNALALDLGVPNGLRLGEALQRVRNARIVTRRPVIVERLDREERHLAGFLVGAGVFNTVIDAGQVAHKLGAFQSAAVGLTAIAGVVQALVGIGNSPWRRTSAIALEQGNPPEPVEQSPYGRPGERYGLGITTLQNFPLGIRPFGKQGGTMRYVAWDTPLRRVIALVPLILLGWDPPFLRRLGMFRDAADELRLTLEGQFILDGEAFPGGELRVAPGHEVQFLVP